MMPFDELLVFVDQTGRTMPTGTSIGVSHLPRPNALHPNGAAKYQCASDRLPASTL